MRVKKVVVKKRPAKKKRVAPRRKSSSVIDRIEPLGVGLDDGIKINLYGRSATGKTTLWATFPKPILAIICSGAKKAGELLSINTPEYNKTVEKVVLHESYELRELTQMQQETEKYATVVLDHASGLQTLIAKEVAGLEEIPMSFFRAASKGQSWGVVSQSQWGQIGTQTNELLYKLLALSCNVVVVAQEKERFVDQESEVITPFVGSDLTPMTLKWFHPACNYIVETFIRPKTVKKKIRIASKVIVQETRVPNKVEYCLRVGPHDVFTTKFRIPKGKELPPVIVDPTYAKIKALIDGE